MKYTLSEIARHIGATLHGDESSVVTGLAPLTTAISGQLSFFENLKYRKPLAETKATAVILSKEYLAECPVNALVVAKPYFSFVKLATMLFAPPLQINPGIHPTAIIGENCKIHPSASIGAYCHISSNVTIEENVVVGAGCHIDENCYVGANSRLYPKVSIYSQVKVGQRVIIHSGVVIGADGFGFLPNEGQWLKIPQMGGVTIGNDVEIGANTTIDRGALEDTVIGNGVKLDNLIQIGHNVKIGDHTVMASSVIVGGSTRIGKYCMMGGGVGIADNIEIADQVIITAMAGLSRSINQPGVYSSGTRAQPNHEWRKSAARFHQLDEMARRLRTVEKTLIQDINDE